MSGKIVRRFTPTTIPSKICITCGRPFTWRKKWERAWDEIKYCSGRCRRGKDAAAAGPAPIQVISKADAKAKPSKA